MESIQQHDIVVSITDATREVFSTMLALPVSVEQAREESAEPEHLDGVVALVGIGGSWTGSGRICCSPRMAAKLASALLMTNYDAVNEDVLDAVAEVANIIIGNVKTFFEE